MGPNVRDHIRNPENRALYRLKISKKHFFFEECVLFFFFRSELVSFYWSSLCWWAKKTKELAHHRRHPLFLRVLKLWIVRDTWFLVFFYIFWCFEHVKKLLLLLLLLRSRWYQRKMMGRGVTPFPSGFQCHPTFKGTQERGEHENNCNSSSKWVLMGKDTRKRKLYKNAGLR